MDDKTCEFCYKEKGSLFVYPRCLQVYRGEDSHFVCLDCFSVHCDEWKTLSQNKGSVNSGI